ncbi:3590_t:CDS:1, partial [Dentiscutata heterogama]
YEQILPNDAFGSVMLQNLKYRNIELRGIHAYPDLESQKDRYLSRGWTHAEAVDMNEIYDIYIDSKEHARYFICCYWINSVNSRYIIKYF